MAAFQRGVKKYSNSLSCSVDFIYIDAGQHYDHELAGGFIGELGVKFDQRIDYAEKDPIDIFADMYRKLYRLIRDINNEKPLDYVVVFGDANATMVGSLVASKQGIPLIHIEAGLRLGTLKSPEESNRIMADHLSELRAISCKPHFDNLLKEGLSGNSFFTGDIIYDLVNEISDYSCVKEIDYYIMGKKYVYSKDDFIISSLHRNENLRDNVLPTFFKAMESSNRPVFFIAHKQIENAIGELKYNKEQITITDHVPYFGLINALKNCAYIMTDSGAFQREAYYLKKRCLIRQEIAFWQTLVEQGIHRLIGKDLGDMMDGIKWIEEKITKNNYPATDVFGDGMAMKKILEIIANG
jgi:UDP-N-acetylglucosamine 2-epimerase